MSVTAVPLRPTPYSAKIKLALGVAVLLCGGIGLAMAGTTDLVRAAMPASVFLAKNAKRPGVQTTASGLQYKIEREGNGPHPTENDFVLVNYEGRLPDGTVFDSSYKRGEPAAFPIQGLIPGWTEGLQLMTQGSKYHFWIPPELAYGPQGAGNGVIPPNAVLEFDVELLQIAPRSALGAMGQQ